MYTVSGYDHYERGEVEVVFESLEDAQEFAGMLIDEGGNAEIYDGSGTICPI